MQDKNSQSTIHINLNTVMLFVIDIMLLVSMLSTQSSTFQAKAIFAIIYIILFSAIEHLPRIHVFHQNNTININLEGFLYKLPELITFLASILLIFICALVKFKTLLVLKQCFGLACFICSLVCLCKFIWIYFKYAFTFIKD